MKRRTVAMLMAGLLVGMTPGAGARVTAHTAHAVYVPGTLLVRRTDFRSMGGSGAGGILFLHGNTRRIVTHRIPLSAPVVSSHHHLIAVGSIRGLYWMDASGKSLHAITHRPTSSPCGNGPLDFKPMSWSVDEQMLAYNIMFGSDALHRCPPGIRDVDGTWVVDRRTGWAKQLPGVGEVFWSGVGHRVMTMSTSTAGMTVLRNPARGSHFVVLSGASSLSFSPDHRWLAYSTIPRAGHSRLWIARVNANHPRAIARFRGFLDYLSWSPDGHSIASGFRPTASSTGARARLVIVQVQRRTVRFLQWHIGGIDTPVWSPDGSQLAYITGPLVWVGPFGVWLVRARGGGATQILHLGSGKDAGSQPRFDGLAWF